MQFATAEQHEASIRKVIETEKNPPPERGQSQKMKLVTPKDLPTHAQFDIKEGPHEGRWIVRQSNETGVWAKKYGSASADLSECTVFSWKELWSWNVRRREVQLG